MNTTQRVAIVTPSLLETAGGVETFCSMLAQVLEDHGHEIQLFAPKSASNRALAKFGLSHIERSQSLRRSLRDWAPDVVISNGTLGYFGPNRFNRWKHIHVFHGTMVAHSLADRAGRSYRDWLVRGVMGGGLSELLSGLGTIRIAVSQSCAREVSRYYRLGIRRVIPNAVHIDNLPDEKRAGLIFVGRRESRKGYDLAVKIAQEAGSVLSVAGPGTDSRTRDLGVLAKGELVNAYRRHLAMVFPSNYEACSFAILEALANGCAVVTTAVGWIPELLSAVPEYSLLIGEGNDVACFSAAVDRVQSGDEATMLALQKAVEWTRLNNSYDRFSDQWSSLLATVDE